MTNIAVVGATGNIGKRIVDEALARGHHVTGTTRTAANLAPRAGLTVAEVEPSNSHALARVLRGQDAVIVSLKWDVNDFDAVLEGLRESGVKRCLIVVGAGSLMRADGRLHFAHMPNPAPSSKPAMIALEKLRAVTDLDWTAISPSAVIQAGERTGKFRLADDDMIVDGEGNSRISREDFAVAILDEIEHPKHIRRRFTAGY